MNSSQSLKKICAITMARNDAFFVKKWISYYGKELGEENLYLFLDGEDQSLPFDTGKVHVCNRVRVSESVLVGDRTRIAFLNEKVKELLQTYDLVIGGDVDEFLVVDPCVQLSLQEYISQISVSRPVSGLGVDVGHHLKTEKPISIEAPFLSQRSYAILDSQYTKPILLGKPLTWGAGFHRVKNHNYRIDKNLYLFHFGLVDYDLFMSKCNDAERHTEGWERHMQQRLRPVNRLNTKKALDGNIIFPIARFLQTVIRYPYAWFRPFMLYWRVVVRIPSRFSSSL